MEKTDFEARIKTLKKSLFALRMRMLNRDKALPLFSLVVSDMDALAPEAKNSQQLLKLSKCEEKLAKCYRKLYKKGWINEEQAAVYAERASARRSGYNSILNRKDK